MQSIDQQTQVVVGLGKSGLSLVRFLARHGQTFAVADSRENPPELNTLQRDYPQITVHCGALPAELLSAAQVLYVSPGLALSTHAIQAAIANGVTISGGEPMQQPAALEALLRGIRERTSDSFGVLLYSGYAWEKISERVTSWHGLADALIAGPFDQSSEKTLAWRGSDNQTLHPLTPLGQEKYAPWISANREMAGRALDLCFHQDEIWMAGIPDEIALEAIRAELAASGFVSENSSVIPPIFA